MAHFQQQLFVQQTKQLFPQNFNNAKVLECGSLDVNGSIRCLFSNCSYLGIDNHSGPGVDLVMPLHNINNCDSKELLYNFDTVISCEMLEHDFYWDFSVKKMYSLLKPDGLLIITCGGYNRKIHGVQEFASDPKASHYKNITVSDFSKAFDLEFLFKDFTIHYNGGGDLKGDFYFWGVKRYF